ncbi:MAG: hypothetical protein WCI74_01195 [Actinomycetes bacterium]
MAKTHTSTSIEDVPGGVRITMPVPSSGCVSIFLAVWLTSWAVGEFSAIRGLLSVGTASAPASAFMLFWLVGWTLGGIIAIGAFAMSLGGLEIVTVADGVIRRRAEAFGVGLSWRYPLERCSNFRPTGGEASAKTFVSFDHVTAKGDTTVRFGSGLTESRAEEIAERVWAEFPQLMPDHERRKREREAAPQTPPIQPSV